MSLHYIVMLSLSDSNSRSLLTLLREAGGVLKNNGQCKTYLPVNRSNIGRIDCYIFNSSLSEEEIHKFFKERFANEFTITDQKVTPDLLLVMAAAEIVDLLLSNYSDDERLDKLFKEHFHYIFNSLGYDYLAEANLYRQAYSTLSRYIEDTNANHQ